MLERIGEAAIGGLRHSDAEQGRGMRIHSTVESVEARQPTLLAIFETFLSIAIYAFIAWRFQTYVHFVVAVLFAPLFLLRTKRSTEWVQKIYLDFFNKVIAAIDAFDVSNARFRHIVLFELFVLLSFTAIVLNSIFVRFISTFYWALMAPVASVRAIPGNWIQQALSVDIFFLPELIPGENFKKKLENNNSFQLLGTLSVGMWGALRERERSWAVVALMGVSLVPPIVIAYGFSFFYRIGFKATSIFYFPLFWVSSVGLNDERPIYERLSRFGVGELEKARRTLSLVIAPVVAIKTVVMLGFVDLKAAVEKLVESSWFVFLKPLLEQLLNPGFMAWWVAAVAIEIVLTYALFYFADEAIARKDGAKPWPEKRVEAIASFLITLRSAVAVLLVCSGVVFAVTAFLHSPAGIELVRKVLPAG